MDQIDYSYSECGQKIYFYQFNFVSFMNHSEQRRWVGSLRGVGLGIIGFCVFLYIVRGADIPILLLLGAIGFVTFLGAHITLKKVKPEGSNHQH